MAVVRGTARHRDAVMRWHDGPIENAVSKVKSMDSFLLVFIQGDDNLSKEYESCLNRVRGFKNQAFVAVKVMTNSTAHHQFKQIYVKVPIPSVFIIENNGIPIHVISTHKMSEICDAISKTVIELNKKFKKENEVEIKETITETSLENSPSKPLESAKNASVVTNSLGFPRHKILDVHQDKPKQRPNEIRAFPRFLLLDPPPNVDPVPVPVSLRPPPKIHSARIQFRLPNNETPSWEFPDLSTLRDVRAFITEKMNLPPNFKFMRSYPRTAITQRDEYKTLSDLSLMPNATLIVVPIKNETKKVEPNPRNVVSRFSFLSSILSALLVPFFTVIKFFKKHIFGERAEIDDDENEPAEPARTVRKNRIDRKFASNIHGFKFDRDDSDGDHPDNGNSTQQSYRKKK